jgi:hypothetical protein
VPCLLQPAAAAARTAAASCPACGGDPEQLLMAPFTELAGAELQYLLWRFLTVTALCFLLVCAELCWGWLCNQAAEVRRAVLNAHQCTR